MSRVIIFTCIGISAESGIMTFRDACSYDSLDKNRELVLKFYDARRVRLAKAKPNKVHIQTAKLQKKYPDDIIRVIKTRL